MRRFGIGGGEGCEQGGESKIFLRRFLISAWRTLQTPCLCFSHEPLLCFTLCSPHPAGTTSLPPDSKLLSIHQWPWARKSRGQDKKSLTCMLLTSRALQQGGSKDLTPFLRDIDNNFLERPFIPGLQTSFEYYGVFPVSHHWWDQVMGGKWNN